MKTTSTLSRRFFSALALLAFAGFYSCSDDDTATSTEEQDAVDAITYSLESESNGLAKNVENASIYATEENIYAKTATIECGVTNSLAYSETYLGTNYSYDYAVSRNTLLNCDADGLAQSFSYDASYEGVYDTPRMSSNDSSTADWSVTGIDAATENAIFDGAYVRNGSQVSKVRNQNTFTSTIAYSLDDINVSKTTNHIVSGSANVSFNAQSSNGNVFSYSGSITFNGNGTATLVINGNTYTINLY